MEKTQQHNVMSWTQAIEQRHAVRAYTDQPVEQWKLDVLQSTIDDLNLRSGFAFQMVSGVDDALLGLKPHYGCFSGVHNAVAFMGDMHRVREVIEHYGTAAGVDPVHCRQEIPECTGSDDIDELQEDASTAQNVYGAVDLTAGESALSDEQKFFEQAVGYYGEYLVLVATRLGLATSWVVLDQAHTARNPWWKWSGEEQVVWFMTFGYPARVLTRRRSKTVEELVNILDGSSFEETPQWFQAGVHAAMLAPTSLSQQPFHITFDADSTRYDGDGVVTITATEGLFAHVGLGCATLHFELAACEVEYDPREESINNVDAGVSEMPLADRYKNSNIEVWNQCQRITTFCPNEVHEFYMY